MSGANSPLLPVQCRMARAALGWSLDALSEESGVNRWTILRFEQGETAPRARNREALRVAFERAGVRFLSEGANTGGVVPPISALPIQST